MDSLKFKAISDVGLVRTNNEDSFIAEFIWDQQHVLCAAIDGVGGYEGGEVAAEIARSTIIDFLNRYPDPNLKDVIAQAVLQANNDICEQRKEGSRFPKMSCVLSAALIDMKENKIYIAHVGDSRIYLYNKGRLTKLTHDHSLVGYREELGELTEEEAMHHPRRNIIERCLGEKPRVFGEPNFIENAVFDIPANGKLVFCSDGLTDMVTSQEIIDILSGSGSTGDKCSALIECAKSHGGNDNVTVVLVETQQNTVSTEELSAVADLQTDQPESNPAPAEKPSCPPLLLRLAIPVLTLVAGFIGGMFFTKGPEPAAPDPLTWDTVLLWCQRQAPADTASVRTTDAGDSVVMAKQDYLQYRFYQDNVRTIIDLKNAAEHENDSLNILLAQKDSLLEKFVSDLFIN